ncbi:MAG: hypothetical protein ACRD2A_22720, partial [Vicinamibacterales bacterium]
AFPREPDFSIGCAITGDEHRVVVARSAEDGEIVGVACRSVRHVFLNGRDERVGYLGQLRVDERFRGRWLVSRGFALLEQMDRQDPLPAYLASIVDGNDEATGVLVGRRRRTFPAFHAVANYQTLALPTRRRKSELTGVEKIVQGSSDQVPELVAFLRTEGARYQLASVWTEDGLTSLDAFGLRIEDVLVARRKGTIVGVAALWDQSAYKQAVVRGYSGWLKALAPLILPRVGDEVRSVYASLIHVANDEPALFGRLLREAYNMARARGLEYLLVGLEARDPLLEVVRAYRHFAYPSRLYLASWSRGGLVHEQLDGRLARVDIATL